jgi:trehalose-phosphatase
VQHLFKQWQGFSAALRVAPHVLLLSDYDGTLTPIVGRPVDAVLPAGVRDKLSSLAQKPDISIGIISGRSLADLRSLVGIGGIYYAGNHGLEIEGPGLSFTSEAAGQTESVIKDIAGRLAAALENVAGVIIEDKGLSLSLHYRLVRDDEINAVTETFQQLALPLVNEGKVRVTSGKKVLEIRPPVDWDKGKAVATIAGEIKTLRKLESVLVVYLGDDKTDEDAFRTLKSPAGWGVYIGGENTSSSAGYYLNSTGEVEELLSRILALG